MTMLSQHIVLFSNNLPYSLGVFSITDATKSGIMRSSVVTLSNIMIDQNGTCVECWSKLNTPHIILSTAIIISG